MRRKISTNLFFLKVTKIDFKRAQKIKRIKIPKIYAQKFMHYFSANFNYIHMWHVKLFDWLQFYDSVRREKYQYIDIKKSIGTRLVNLNNFGLHKWFTLPDRKLSAERWYVINASIYPCFSLHIHSYFTLYALIVLLISINYMFLNKMKPTSNGRRWVVGFLQLPTWSPNCIRLKNKSGRSYKGTINTRHRKTPSLRWLHSLSSNFFYSKYLLLTNLVVSYKKKSFISVMTDCYNIKYFFRYISGLDLGSITSSNCLFYPLDIKYFIGARLRLDDLTRGQICSNIVFKDNLKSYATAAGVYSIIVHKELHMRLVIIRLPSGSRKILPNSLTCFAGRIGKENSYKEIFGKAGVNVLYGYRPSVRGVAMNPVDHPHGGRTKTISPETSPWGWVTKVSH